MLSKVNYIYKHGRKLVHAEGTIELRERSKNYDPRCGRTIGDVGATCVTYTAFESRFGTCVNCAV
jgi:hypothetical protein